jgi:hypothetical protein
MEGRSSQRISRNALLSKILLNTATASDPRDSDAKNEAPWAPLLRMAAEKQSRGDFGALESSDLNEPTPEALDDGSMRSALLQLLLRDGDVRSSPAPSSPLFLRANVSSMPPAAHRSSHLPSNAVLSDPSVSTIADDSRVDQAGQRLGPFQSGRSISPTEFVSANESVLASYQDAMRPRPGWSPPGVFDPWAEHFIRGMQGLLNFRSRAPASGPNAPGCKEEWDHARETCIGLAREPRSPQKRKWGLSEY